MFCWKCGAKIDDGLKFCTQCGTLLESTADDNGEAGTALLNSPVGSTDSDTESIEDSYDDYGGPGGRYDDYGDPDGSYGDYGGPDGRYDDYDGPDGRYDDYDDPDGHYDDYGSEDGRYDSRRSGYPSGSYDDYPRGGRSSRSASRKNPGQKRKMPVIPLILGFLIAAAAIAFALLWFLHLGPFKLKEDTGSPAEVQITVTPTPILPGADQSAVGGTSTDSTLSSGTGTAIDSFQSSGTEAAAESTPAFGTGTAIDYPDTSTINGGMSSDTTAADPQAETAAESSGDSWDVWE